MKLLKIYQGNNFEINFKFIIIKFLFLRVLIKNVKKSETICEKRIHLEKNTKNDTNKQSNMCC